MSQGAKKYAEQAAESLLRTGKRVAARNPTLKRFLVRALGYVAHRFSSDDGYQKWLRANYPDAIALRRMKIDAQTFKRTPNLSIIVPTYNTHPTFLRECIESVLSQVYDNWELCIVDDASPNAAAREIIKEYAEKDPRIKYTFLKKNLHISGASNKAVNVATGEFVAFLDHDDMLWPNALYEVAKALNDNADLDFIYSDEDKITHDRHHHALPFFKPDWNPDFLRSVNYITHFSVVRKALIEKVGGFREKCNGAQDWDLFLRITHATDKIHHIPTVLYSWRISETSTAKDTSTKPYVVQAQKTALEDDLKRRGLKGTVRQNKRARDYWTIEYEVKDEPLVSIVIPSKNQYKIIKTCINSVLSKTTYRNYEIVLVDTGSTDRRVLLWYKSLLRRSKKVRIIHWPEKPFSFVRSCNEGARQARGEYLVMLNNDTEVLTPNWIEQFLGYAQQKDIAAVGAKLYYPGRDMIQHAGVGIGFGGYAANALAMLRDTNLSPQQHLYMHTAHNMSAVTAACLMVKKSKFDEVGGFAEKFRITYNDVDLCLRFLEAGYRIVYLPEVQFIHYESFSLGTPEEAKKRDTKEFRAAKALFERTWRKYIDHDPSVNPNISRENAKFDIDTDIRRYG